MQDWIRLLPALLSFLAAVVRLSKERGGSAEAQSVTAIIEENTHAIEQAIAARAAVANELGAYPERLREDDGFRREAED